MRFVLDVDEEILRGEMSIKETNSISALSVAHPLADFVDQEIVKWPAIREALLKFAHPEDVHDLRVSLRRVRTVARSLADNSQTPLADIDFALHELFHILGEVRDLDIAISKICDIGLKPRMAIQGELLRMRMVAVSNMQSVLAKHCVLDDIGRLHDAMVLANATQDAAVSKTEIIRFRRKAIKSFNSVEKKPDLIEMHRLRRRVKRMRYAVEFNERLCGGDGVYVRRLVKLQDHLGGLMDAVSTKRLLAKMEFAHEQASEERKLILTQLNKSIVLDQRAILRLKNRLSGSPWKRLKENMENCGALGTHLIAQQPSVDLDPAA
jgi:CHAD domain-containing protein